MANEAPSIITQLYTRAITEIRGRFGSLTEMAAEQVQNATNGSINQNTTKDALPYIAAGAAGITGLLLVEPISKLGKGLFRGIKTIVTGGGYFEKIPVLGYAFQGLGWALDRLGDVSGYLISGAASLLAFQLFQKPVQHYNSAPRSDTPNSGTGAPEMPAQRRDMNIWAPGSTIPTARESVPVAPAVTTPGEHNGTLSPAQLEEARNLSYTQLTERRTRALANGRTSLQEAYTQLMREQNLEFGARRRFIIESREFEGTPTSDSARNRMIGALTRDVGLKEQEAQALVMRPPQLRATIYPGATATQDNAGGNGISANGDLPTTLLDFAHNFESTYGPGFIFSVNDRHIARTPLGNARNFDALTPTEQVEYIEKALQFCRDRHAFFHRTCLRTRSYAAGEMSGGSWQEWDYTDNSSLSLWQSLRGNSGPQGNTNYPAGNVTWAAEHEFLQQANADSYATSNDMFGSYGGVVNGNGLQNLRGGFNAHQQTLNEYKQTLAQAQTQHNGAIAQSISQARFMEYSFNMIRDHSVALVARGQYNDRWEPTAPNHSSRYYIQVRDLRGATPTPTDNSRLLRWEGEWVTPSAAATNNDWRFIVRAVSNPDGTRRTLLDQPITIDLSTGANTTPLLEAIDQKRNPRQPAVQTSMLNEVDVASPLTPSFTPAPRIEEHPNGRLKPTSQTGLNA